MNERYVTVIVVMSALAGLVIGVGSWNAHYGLGVVLALVTITIIGDAVCESNKERK